MTHERCDPKLVNYAGPGTYSYSEALAGRGKETALTRARELVTLVGVEVYRQRVTDLAAAMGMNAGSVSRALARAIAREREERAFHQRRLALEERLAEVEASESPRKVRW